MDVAQVLLGFKRWGVAISCLAEAQIPREGISPYNCLLFHVLAREFLQCTPFDIKYDSEPDAPRHFPTASPYFYSANYYHFPKCSTSPWPFLCPADVGLIHLNYSAQFLSLQLDQSGTEFMEHQKGCLVAGEPYLTLELESRHSGGVSCDEIRRPEPSSKGLFGTVHHGSSGN